MLRVAAEQAAAVARVFPRGTSRPESPPSPPFDTATRHDEAPERGSASKQTLHLFQRVFRAHKFTFGLLRASVSVWKPWSRASVPFWRGRSSGDSEAC